MRTLFIYFNQEYRPRTLLSINILETVVKAAGHTTSLFDTSFYPEAISPEVKNLIKAGIHKQVNNLVVPVKNPGLYKDLVKRVESFKPDLISFSYYSLNTDLQREMLIPLKKLYPDIPMLAGGPQPSINAARCVEEEYEYMDWVCCGEGEELIVEMCNRIEKGEELRGIKGLWYRGDDGETVNGGVAPMTDMDKLPIQDLSSYDPVQLYGLFEGAAYRMGHVEFTRGCPYDCSYCGAGSIRKLYTEDGQASYVRSRDPVVAVREYKALKEKYNLDMFYFIDGTFLAMPTKVLEKLAHLYKKEVNLPFIALVHPNTIKEKTAELLRVMGCVHVSMGVESGLADYRTNILNRRMTNKQIIKSIRLLRSKGIHVSAYNLIGLPGMDRKHLFKTIQLNRDANPHSSLVSIFIPYLDNDMTRNLISEGLLDVSTIEVKNGLEPTVRIPDMDATEIKAIFNTFNLYLRLPKWTWRFIKLLERENVVTRFIRKTIYGILRIVGPKAPIKPLHRIKIDEFFSSRGNEQGPLITGNSQ